MKGSNVENRIFPAFVVNSLSFRRPSNEAGLILFSTFDPFLPPRYDGIDPFA